MTFLHKIIDALMPKSLSEFERLHCRTCGEGPATIRFRDGTNGNGEKGTVFELAKGQTKVCKSCLRRLIKGLLEDPKRKWSVGPRGLNFSSAGNSGSKRSIRVRPAAWRLVVPGLWRDWDNLKPRAQHALTRIRQAMADK